ncbi:winged helix-turn-helix domain-containing protein [Acanthopleuribacter pedis]|uniref:Winged helix-turn-helix domain-containing protein n=1 Tax=Acanthopleuribacter pedis TaxID=442870 RepID=A0A8J7QS58_9BACT|nr:winged helix-turn-helix domain-containing protein [Acanthopleuribacter pedis]MBO1323275.1 winged helix-turn-helix domain-containing protein [Acanthopleuribacter pedis]
MTEQYWIGDFFIDCSRNQITHHDQSQTLAPKTLAVLTYLAKHQGRVVSQDTLLAEVWFDAVVSTNTLQKSIAHLRKALGDDAKRQTTIRTHAKQGYSLEVPVRRHEQSSVANDLTPEPPPEAPPENMGIAGDGVGPETARTPDHQPQVAGPPTGPPLGPPTGPPLGAPTGPPLGPPTGPPLGPLSESPPGPAKARAVSIQRTALLAGIIVLALLGWWMLPKQPNPPLRVTKIQSLTATDDKEFDADYSPDGQYIIFHRYDDLACVNKVWAKNIATQKEHQLTQDWGAYRKHSLSPDGKTLVLLANAPCDAAPRTKNCYDLVYLDFEQALVSPRVPDLLLRCENTQLKNPMWVDNDHIALLQKPSDRWKLILYSVSGRQSEVLVDLQDGEVVDFDYARQAALFAVIRMDRDSRPVLDLRNLDGSLRTSRPIALPPEAPQHRPIYPTFDPGNQRLVFSTGRQLFTLSYDGRVDKIAMPHAETLMLPEFHPNGKRLLLIKGPLDTDVWLVPMDNLTPTDSDHDRSQPSFERSILGEDSGLFQPNGPLIAFWSDRTGDHQVWVSDGRHPRQLTHFPMDTYIRGFDWAADGESMLINGNSRLVRVFLDGREQPIPLASPVVRLYQWDSGRNNALFSARFDGADRLVTADLNTGRITIVSEAPVIWADRDETGALVFRDSTGRYWQPGPVEAKEIKPLAAKGKDAKVFRLKDRQLYGISREKKLWRYHLDTEVMESLGQVGGNVSHLTDLNQTHLLMSTMVSSKKEVIELHLKD